MNGAARVDDENYFARVEDNDYFVAAPRYKSALDRYIKTAVATNDNLTEADVAKIVLSNTASKSAHSRTSQSSARVWESLDDLDRVRSIELKDQKKRLGAMTAVAPVSKSLASSTASINDLVPAGLTKASDGMVTVEPIYNKVGEHIRRNTPNEMQCSMFCGGKKCRYETSEAWDSSDMAIPGVYSHWITEDLVAMSRPNTAQMNKARIIQSFNKAGIKSIVNLQMPGEHASCGPKLEASGFTYDPNEFMKNSIFFYNFVWKDYEDTSMGNLLDMVKVLSFALSEGKVAVHCHAGLGRTGVLIACYLVYYLRVRSADAIRYVRLKRPNAVQTRRQIACVKEFETYFLPQCIVYSNKPIGDRDKKLGRFIVETHLKRQKFLVHGYEARALKYVPKILYVICERLIKLCDEFGNVYNVNVNNFTRNFFVHKLMNSNGNQKLFSAQSQETTPSDSLVVTRRSSRSMLLAEDDTTSTAPAPSDTRPTSETNSHVQSCSSALSGVDDKRLDEILADGIKGQTLAENKVTQELASHMDLQKAALEERLPIFTADQVYEGLAETHIIKAEPEWQTDYLPLLKQYQADLNFKVSSWDRMSTETNVPVLAILMFEWLEHLKAPILNMDNITYVVIHCDNLEKAFKRLPNAHSYTIEYLIRFVARIQPLKREKAENVMKRLIASLAHQSVPIEGTLHPVGKNFPKLRGGTLTSILKFFMKIYDMTLETVVTSSKQQSAKSQKSRLSKSLEHFQSSQAKQEEEKSNGEVKKTS